MSNKVFFTFFLLHIFSLRITLASEDADAGARYKLNLNNSFSEGRNKNAFYKEVEFSIEYGRLFTRLGEVKPEYYGVKGLFNFKHEFYPQSTIDYIYGLLKKEIVSYEMNALHWPFYPPVIDQHDIIEIRNLILEENGRVKTIYIDEAGLEKFAHNFYQGKKQISYEIIAQVLTKDELFDLNWNNHEFKMSQEQLIRESRVNLKLYDQILRPNEYTNEESRSLKEIYTKKSGYELYSDQFHNGDMEAAYNEAMLVLPRSEFLKLEWGDQFTSSTTVLRRIRSLLANNQGRIDFERWFGYSEETFGRAVKEVQSLADILPHIKDDPKTAINLLLNSLSETEKETLGWRFVESIDFNSSMLKFNDTKLHERTVKIMQNRSFIDPRKSLYKGKK